MPVKIFVFVIATAMALGGCASISKNVGENTLTGDWAGDYSFKESPGHDVHVDFRVSLIQTGTRLEGSIVEPNKLDPPGASSTTVHVPQLTATIHDGEIIDDQVHFRKQYNGEGGYTHSVIYSGILTSDRRKIVGQWTVGENVGPFSMVRNAGSIRH